MILPTSFPLVSSECSHDLFVSKSSLLVFSECFSEIFRQLVLSSLLLFFVVKIMLRRSCSLRFFFGLTLMLRRNCSLFVMLCCSFGPALGRLFRALGRLFRALSCALDSFLAV